jgi:hypothetical protein
MPAHTAVRGTMHAVPLVDGTLVPTCESVLPEAMSLTAFA